MSCVIILALLWSPFSAVAMAQDVSDTHLTEETLPEEFPDLSGEEAAESAVTVRAEETAAPVRDEPAADTPLVEEELVFAEEELEEVSRSVRPSDEGTSDTQAAPTSLGIDLQAASDTHRYGTITTGTTFPTTSLTDGMVFRFTAAVASGLSAYESNGNTAKSSAAKDDMFRYRLRDTRWLFMGNGATGNISSDVDNLTSDTSPTFVITSSPTTINEYDEGLWLVIKKQSTCANNSAPQWSPS